MLINKLSNHIPAKLPSYAVARLQHLQSDKKTYHPARMILNVLGINLIPIIVLLFFLALMGDYRQYLITQELELLHSKTQLYSHQIMTGHLEDFNGVTDKNNETIFVFSSDGTRIFDRNLEIFDYVQHGEVEDSSFLGLFFESFLSTILNHSFVSENIPPYPQIDLENPETIPGVKQSLSGDMSLSVWVDDNEKLLFSSSVPIAKGNGKALSLTIIYMPERLMANIFRLQEDISRIFLSIFVLSVAFSLYLVGTITHPLRRLAMALEAIRSNTSVSGQVIPDMSHRGDEIGELSVTLNSMVEALWERMGMIEMFAADVSHELKNPITSLKSAIETLRKVKNKKDKEQLINILEHDVDRLDRLITDISKSSRLDTELSQGQMVDVDVYKLSNDIVKQYGHQGVNVVLTEEEGGPFIVKGYPDKLFQVLTNLVDNAYSFTKSPITLTLCEYKEDKKGYVMISVEDKGPGIPENKLKTVFQRFYSDRPKKQGEAHHSGLGLSIVKQIVNAHSGIITAKNVAGSNNKVSGAIFEIILPKV